MYPNKSDKDIVRVRLWGEVRKTVVTVKTYEKKPGEKRRKPSKYKIATTRAPVDRKCRLLWFRLRGRGLPTWIVVAAPTSVDIKSRALVGPRSAVAKVLAALPDELIGLPGLGATVDINEAAELLEEARVRREVTVKLVDPWGGDVHELRTAEGIVIGEWYELDMGYKVMNDVFEDWCDLGFCEEEGEGAPPPKNPKWRPHELPKDYCRRAGCEDAQAWEHVNGREVIVVQRERDEWGVPGHYVYWWVRGRAKPKTLG